MAGIDISKTLNLGNDATGNSITPNQYDGKLLEVVSIILRNIYVIAAIILFLMIFIGGIGMIINAGNAEKQKQSSKTLGSAVTGFLILFLSYWLLRILQLFTGIQLVSFT